MARGFQQVSVIPLGAQASKERFSSRDGNPKPKIATWRCNVTALSQYYNLYFVAYLDRIHVYQPKFPTQSISSLPDLIISLPVSSSDLSGYIDVNSPHNVNSLLAEDLGDQEIIVCACDDGDVLAFFTSSILKALQTQVELKTPLETSTDAIKPFFHENVGRSAWGLAVHPSHRMIAVSANTSDITVFLFGLADTGSSSDSDFQERAAPHKSRQASKSSQNNAFRLDRSTNMRIVLTDHENNIPNVSFFKDESHSEYTWLASTDIEGWIMLWNVELQSLVYKRRAVVGGGGAAGREYDYVNGQRHGWTAICLGTDSFSDVHSLQDLFGCEHTFPFISQSEGQNEVHQDITGSIAEVHNASNRDPSNHPRFVGVVNGQMAPQNINHQTDSESDESLDSEDAAEDEMSSSEDSDDADDDNLPEDLELMDIPALHLAQPNASAPLASQSFEAESAYPIHDNSDNEAMEDPWEGTAGIDDEEALLMTDDEEDPDMLTAFDTRSCLSSVEENSTTNFTSAAPLPEKKLDTVKVPSFAVLHTSEVNIRLFSKNVSGPSTLLRSPLVQPAGPETAATFFYQRLNMVQIIPDLSIAVVATQAGRAAVLKLTRSSAATPQLSFRLEWVLPFADQERERLRPYSPLLGIATAPVQGMERATKRGDVENPGYKGKQKQSWRRVESQRRYRLMLMYHDSTVLSYELGRDTDADLTSGSYGPLVL